MIDLMYESPSPKPSPSITLECMWKVQTDTSYHGVRGSLHKDNCIAILTVGGIGNVGFPFGNVELLPGTLIVFPYHDMNYYRPQKEDWRFSWSWSDLPFVVIKNKKTRLRIQSSLRRAV